jgi:surfactin synthase thioesterase subunit
VCAIQLPGREDRFREPPYDDLETLLDAFEAVILPLTDRPFALLGVSMGAILQFELARRFRKRFGREPFHVFVAAAAAPDRRPNGAIREMVASLDPSPLARAVVGVERLRRLRREDITAAGLIAAKDFVRDTFAAHEIDVEVLRRYDLVPDVLLAEPELVRRLMPVMQADLGILKSYRFRREAPFACPITAFGGRRDILIGERDLEGWARQTRARFTLKMFPGPHLFVRTDRAEVIEAVVEDLTRARLSPSAPTKIERPTPAPSE